MKITRLSQALDIIKEKQPLGFENSFEIAKLCARALTNPEEEKSARDIIIRTLDIWDKLHHETFLLWNDLVECAGLYPYLKTEMTSGSTLLRHEYNKSNYLGELYFHEEQNELAFKLLAGKSVVLSAPTSFGKSLLIEEIVASHKYIKRLCP